MGRLLAWRLAHEGHYVSLYERDGPEDRSAAAYTAAGMLTPYSEIESAEMLVHELGLLSLQLWPFWLRALGAYDNFHQLGSLILAHEHDRADLRRFKQQLHHKLESDDCMRQLDREGIAKLEPELADHFGEGLFLPDESWLCPRCTLGKLSEKLQALGVRVHHGAEVGSVNPCTITVDAQSHDFDWAVDCRGLGAKKQVPGLRGVRGELIWLEAPEVNISRLVRLIHPRYRLYLVPKGIDNLYIIGATQIESENMGPITVRSTLEMLSAVYSIHPGFAEARIVETRVNCRPALQDNLPRVEREEGLLRINGLFRHGFLLAPALVEDAIAAIFENPQ